MNTDKYQRSSARQLLQRGEHPQSTASFIGGLNSYSSLAIALSIS
ncbi:MAG: hypothetical protein RMX68_030855 [Aulosira sp. ZfuVER01]|nr:hypothetical protein [Aulosira sp. ZfuVER01]MDZ7996879.1 hypothetical protein [Aulosira sp. DedVER01a]MDZ8050005.1 hypothetical protein [Aulosira sp. ZfuCHP01]